MPAIDLKHNTTDVHMDKCEPWRVTGLRRGNYADRRPN